MLLDEELFKQIRKACEDLATKEGSCPEFGLNLACWLGERAHLLVAEIDKFRGELVSTLCVQAFEEKRAPDSTLRCQQVLRSEAPFA